MFEPVPAKEPKPKFFKTPEAFRKWLTTHHETKTELWVGYYKKGSGLPSMTWPESVDEALCHGWIDGLRKSVDEVSYKIRFTPRRPGSVWSQVNLKRVEELKAEGRMLPAGLAIHAKRDPAKSLEYSHETNGIALSPEYEKQVLANKAAWDFLMTKLAPSSRKISLSWVMQAKQETTRQRRLATLIECSARGEKIPLLRWSK